MTLGFALSACVFLVLSIVFAVTSGHNSDHYRETLARNFQTGAWTSLGLSAILFLTAIWAYAITGG